MSDSSAIPPVIGLVASIHLHSKEPGGPFQNAMFVDLEAGKGIIGNPRYFARRSRSGGLSKRQVSLIEREIIAEHAAVLGMQTVAPGTVRSNIETFGIDLVAIVGREVEIGTATLLFYEPRTPCSKMDDICPGLRELMSDNKQGVMAQVIRSGRIQVGDAVRIADPTPLAG